MEDTYILIGLSVLFICCIYLFYLNFKNAREREFLQKQINDLKFELTTRTTDLLQLHQQQHPNPADLASIFMQQQANGGGEHEHIHQHRDIATTVTQEHQQQTSSSDDLPVDLAPGDIENINKLNDIELDDVELDDVELDDVELDDVELDDVAMEEFDVDDLDATLTEITNKPSTVTTEEVIQPPKEFEVADITDISELSQVDDSESAADIADINLKTLTKNELLNSSVKYLKLIAKNCGVSSRGNKESLIAAISKKLEL
jgi:hypothetical protein